MTEPANYVDPCGASQRAEALLIRLRERLAKAARSDDPILEPPPQEVLSWLRAAIGMEVYSPSFEADLAARTHPDLFGRWIPARKAPFLEGVDVAQLPPELVAPFLRRLSLTRADVPEPAGFGEAALRTVSGPVSSVRRSPPARRWGQDEDAPGLPELTVIPHVVHGIWLGGPVPQDGLLAENFAAGARRYAGLVDFVVWTDVSRDEATAAHHDVGGRLGQVRWMLDWAAVNGVSLVNPREVFGDLGRAIEAELLKQLPRGLAAASDHLRLKIVSLLGGAHVDGDNRFDVETIAAQPPRWRLPELFDRVAASDHGFTLHVRDGEGVYNDLIVAPAGHPALLLWQELTRASYRLSQRELFGGLDRMTGPFVGGPRNRIWLRYTVPRRAGRLMAVLLARLGIALDDPRLVRADGFITAGSAMTWSQATATGRPASGEQEVVETCLRVVAATVRRLISREGNLHLPSVAPVITRMPDPASAWVAVLRLLAELADAGLAPAVTSVTRFRWEDDGTPSYIGLPPEAESMLAPGTAGAGWMGAELARSGRPVWLLDELITPVTLLAEPTEPTDCAAGAAGTEWVSARLQYRIETGRQVRNQEATRLLGELRERLQVSAVRGTSEQTGAAAVDSGPLAGPDFSDQMLAWLRRGVGLPLYFPAYEQRIQARLGPDLFGLRVPEPAPAFLRDIGPDELSPELVAPFLRRLSLTRGEAPQATDFASQALAREPGPVSSIERSPERQAWGQDDAPLLPGTTTIPHLVHGIWLGGPVGEGAFCDNFAAGARRSAGVVDFVLWTDVSRADVAEAIRGAGGGRLAGVRRMARWAIENGIHLVNVAEVFSGTAEMCLSAEFAVELAKLLPRGFAGASDHLRLEVVSRFGGAYVDGDNGFDVDSDGLPLPGRLPEMFEEVAASAHGFTLHLRSGRAPGGGPASRPIPLVNNDVIVAPAAHPALLLWRELNRAASAILQRELFGGLQQMAQRHAGRAPDRLWRRYTVSQRAGQVHCRLLARLGIALDDPRLVRVGGWIRPGSTRSWSRTTVLPSAGLSRQEVIDRCVRVVAATARRLISREGNLHLSAVAPVIAGLPHPDAAWIAVLRLLGELVEAGTIPPVTSVTRFRWNDDGTPSYVGLPPEAEALLDYTRPDPDRLGAGLAVSGRPVWLLDEAVVPVRLSAQPVAESGSPIGRLITGAPSTPEGFTGVTLTGRLGSTWAGRRRAHPEDVAAHLAQLRQADRPVLLVLASEPANGPSWFAARLQALLGQRVLLVDSMIGGDGSEADYAQG